MREEVAPLGYKKLLAWQKADLLASEIYLSTVNFPNSELYGITSQLRRAALSVPLNIIEGYGRVSKNEFRRFLSIALGSLSEVEYLLYFANKQRLFKSDEFNRLNRIKEECGRIVWRLFQSQRSKMSNE